MDIFISFLPLNRWSQQQTLDESKQAPFLSNVYFPFENKSDPPSGFFLAGFKHNQVFRRPVQTESGRQAILNATVRGGEESRNLTFNTQYNPPLLSYSRYLKSWAPWLAWSIDIPLWDAIWLWFLSEEAVERGDGYHWSFMRPELLYIF